MYSVIKATGDKEPFNEEKVRSSIHRAGVPDQIQNLVLSHVKNKLYDNIPTSEIYHHIAEFLGKSDVPQAKAKYGLKKAIMDLGPTGYPFEDYVAQLLKTQGYNTQTRTVLTGRCVNHEIDIIATKNSEKIMIEAKFHNQPGTKTDVHVALYSKARFDDIKDKHGFNHVWIITNTKTTIDANAYGNCSGVKIISWSYPNEESLRDMIEKAKLAPITTLTALSQFHKEQLLANHLVLCKDVCSKPSTLDILRLPQEKKKEILLECSFVTQ